MPKPVKRKKKFTTIPYTEPRGKELRKFFHIMLKGVTLADYLVSKGILQEDCSHCELCGKALPAIYFERSSVCLDCLKAT